MMEEKTFKTLFIVMSAVSIVLTGLVIWVVWHFIAKYW